MGRTSVHAVRPSPRALLPNVSLGSAALNSVKWVTKAPSSLVKRAIDDMHNRMHFREMERNPAYLARKLAHERRERDERVYGSVEHFEAPVHDELDIDGSEIEVPEYEQPSPAQNLVGAPGSLQQPLTVEQLDGLAASRVLAAAVEGAANPDAVSTTPDVQVRKSLLHLGSAVQARRDLGRSDIEILNELSEKGSVPMAIALSHASTPPPRGALEHICARALGDQPVFNVAVANVADYVATRNVGSAMER
jgi:hypothetical protein